MTKNMKIFENETVEEFFWGDIKNMKNLAIIEGVLRAIKNEILL